MERVVLQGLLPPLHTVPSHGMSQSFQHASSWMGKGKRETAMSDHSWERHHPAAKTPPGAQPSSFTGLWSGRRLRHIHLLHQPPSHPQHGGAELRDGATCHLLHSDIHQHRLATPADLRPPGRSLESLPLDSHHVFISWP